MNPRPQTQKSIDAGEGKTMTQNKIQPIFIRLRTTARKFKRSHDTNMGLYNEKENEWAIESRLCGNKAGTIDFYKTLEDATKAWFEIITSSIWAVANVYTVTQSPNKFGTRVYECTDTYRKGKRTAGNFGKINSSNPCTEEDEARSVADKAWKIGRDFNCSKPKDELCWGNCNVCCEYYVIMDKPIKVRPVRYFMGAQNPNGYVVRTYFLKDESFNEEVTFPTYGEAFDYGLKINPLLYFTVQEII